MRVVSEDFLEPEKVKIITGRGAYAPEDPLLHFIHDT